MRRRLAVTSMILFAVAMVFSTGGRQATGTTQMCIVHPDELDRCYQSGGRFDWTLCSCVGGGASTVAK
jgi:hypothetical protein